MTPMQTAFRNDALEILLTASDTETLLEWKGSSDARDPGAEITPFLTRVAQDLGARTIVIDFRALEYLNSATVAPIVQFLRLLDSRGVTTKVLLDPSVGWQRVHFVAMKNVAKNLHHIAVEAR